MNSSSLRCPHRGRSGLACCLSSVGGVNVPSAGYLRGAPDGGCLSRAVHVAVFQTSPRVPTTRRTALTAEVLPLNLPVLISIIKPWDKRREKKKIRMGECEWRNEEIRKPYPSSSPARMGLQENSAIRGKRRSWCLVNTRTGNRLGSHRWFINLLTLP